MAWLISTKTFLRNLVGLVDFFNNFFAALIWFGSKFDDPGLETASEGGDFYFGVAAPGASDFPSCHRALPLRGGRGQVFHYLELGLLFKRFGLLLAFRGFYTP